MEHFESSTVLLVTADVRQAAYLSDQLAADGFDVLVAEDAAMGVRSLARAFPDLVIVDARLPDGSGAQVIGAIRHTEPGLARVDPATPAMVLVGGDDPLERTRALERGADDAISMPPHYPEFLARTRALLRRAERRGRRGLVRVGPLSVDPVGRHVHLGAQEIELSQKEFQLLQILASEPTRVFRKDELLRAVWGYRSDGRTRTLDSHACRLRQKLRLEGGEYIVNVWGVGYRLLDGPIEIAASSRAPAAQSAQSPVLSVAA
ncbi:MAG: response regulator transcription factor [Solirubrobacteraceae bacterium]|nr:response regulator transcription factor [Solirubrobacteraceae bacterium]